MSRKLQIVCAALVCCVMSALFFPRQVRAADTPPPVEAGAYIVIDAATGQVLAEKNGYEKHYPASITKILTLGLTLEMQDRSTDYLNQQIDVSYVATHSLLYNSSHVALTEGEVVSLENLLYATQIRSANDAANVLAEHLGGSIGGFAEIMNNKVAQLGLSGSHFMNPSGLPDEQHYTTAFDMAQITRWALGVPGYRELFGATKYTMAPTNKQPLERVFNGDNLIVLPGSTRYYDGVIGSKSGFTTDARYTLVTAARRGDVELVCVVLQCDKNEMKYDSTKALLDYCFDNYAYQSFPAARVPVTNVPVYGGGGNELGEIEVRATEDIPVLLHNSLPVEQLTAELLVPEKYVVGQPFSPVVSLSAPQGNPIQQGLLMAAPLHWDGLDQVLAANTGIQAKLEGETPLPLVIALGAFFTFCALIAGRILYVKYRRHKRKMARSAAARAQLPVRVATTARPVQRDRGTVVYSNIPPKGKPGQGRPVELHIVYRNGQGTPPKRVGRTR